MVFAILAEHEERIAPKIEEAFTKRRVLRIGPGQWLVSFRGTSEEVLERLELEDSDDDGVLILTVSGYSGFTDAHIWEWLESRWRR